jgi:hypothetical protein
VHHLHSKGPSWLIDSGTTSPIHREHSDFSTIAPESGSVVGFNQQQSCIRGHGTVRLAVASPSGGVNTVDLSQTLLIPEAKDLLLSIWCLDQAKCYTLFGAGCSVVFHLDDGGKFFQNVLGSQKVVLTGTLAPQGLYQVDFAW